MSYGADKVEDTFNDCDDLAEALELVAVFFVGIPVGIVTIGPTVLFLLAAFFVAPWLVGLIIPFGLMAGLTRYRADQRRQKRKKRNNPESS